MKYYNVQGQDKKLYVRGYKIDKKKGTISVRFADGTVFKNIVYSEENINKLNRKMETQATIALNCIDKDSATSSQIRELSRIAYRNKNMEYLNEIMSFDNPNYLAGVRKSICKLIKESDNPFGVENIEKITLADLEQLVSNVDRSRLYQFSMAPKVKRK